MQVLLTSKYSPIAQGVAKRAQTLKGLVILYVDNADLKTRILNDETLAIRSVPTFLILKGDGVVEKYEGERAGMKIDQIIEESSKIQSIQSIQSQTTPSLEVSQIQHSVPVDLNPLPISPGVGASGTETSRESHPVLVKSGSAESAERDASEAARVSLPETPVTDILDLDSSTDAELPLQEIKQTSLVQEEDNDDEPDSSSDDPRSNENGMPVRKSSKIGSIAAEMMKQRDEMNAKQGRPGAAPLPR